MSGEKERAIKLREKFGELAEQVVDELIDQAYLGYDYDLQHELPFFNKVREELKTI